MKILVVENPHNRQSMLSGDFSDCEIFTARCAWAAMGLMREKMPEVILCDAVIPGGDGAAMLEAAAQMGLETRPAGILAVTDASGQMMRRLAPRQMQLQKPVSPQTLAQSVQKSQLACEDGVMRAAERILEELGVKHHLKGYALLRSAIKIAALDHRAVADMAQRIYAPLARKSGQSSQNVERTMRFAIESAWDRGRVETIWKMFGYTVRETVGKPSNREFIAMAAERVRTQMRR